MERLVIQDGTAELHLPGTAMRTIPTGDVVRAVQGQGVRGLTEEPLAPTVRWRVECGPLTLYILELEPALRWIRWLSPKSPILHGSRAVYESYRLATPFVVLKVPFLHGKIQPGCEVFYRNAPLSEKGLESELFWPNLLNVSPHSYGCTAWFCTQYLGTELVKSRRGRRRDLSESAQLAAVAHHLWGGGFNRSSEVHEGTSCFSKAAEDGLDPRVTDVERWQKASVKNRRFILKVSWKATDLTVRRLVQKQLEAHNLPRDVSDTSELISVLLAKDTPQAGSKK